MRQRTWGVGVYPVGVLADLLVVGRNLRRRDWRGVRWGFRRLRHTLHGAAEHVRVGNWRDAKNTFNGYLAEHETLGTRCGHGWTKRRALRDLHRHLAEVTSVPRQPGRDRQPND